MATNPPGDVRLAPLDGEARPLSEWLTTFHLAAVILDPYTYESAWLLETSGKILEHFAEADCRVAFVVTASPEEVREFLGPWTKRVLIFADPDREFVKGLGLDELPAFVHLRLDGQIAGVAEGWDPVAWREVAVRLGKDMSWSYPLIPSPGDPKPYAGSPAAG